jgi:putative acetyltransferase
VPVEVGLVDAFRASSEWIPQLSMVAESDEGEIVGFDEPLVALLGHTEYYPRFGFRPADQLGIRPPVEEWASHFQVRVLTTHRPDLRGTFRYAQPFNEL